MQKVMLEFDPDRGYTNVVNRKFLILEDYLSQPVIHWCHERIGAMRWPKEVNEILTGDGWEIYADWGPWLNQVDKPRTYVIITKQVEQRLITEFWMRFQ